MDTHRTLQEAQDYLQNPIDAAHAPYATPFEQSHLYEQKAAQVILQHPFLFMRFCLYGAARILFGSGFEMFFEHRSSLESRLPQLSPQRHGNQHTGSSAAACLDDALLRRVYAFASRAVWRFLVRGSEAVEEETLFGRTFSLDRRPVFSRSFEHPRALPFPDHAHAIYPRRRGFCVF